MASGGGFLPWAWSLVLLAVAASVAAHLLRVHVLPLWPYAAGGAVIVAVGYVAAILVRRSRW